jgi:hypothetical protein
MARKELWNYAAQRRLGNSETVINPFPGYDWRREQAIKDLADAAMIIKVWRLPIAL